MPETIVFDVNETLFDTRALIPIFDAVLGDPNTFHEWFSLLLLHSGPATLAGAYFDFAVLARTALEMATAAGTDPSPAQGSKELLTFFTCLLILRCGRLSTC